MSQRFLDPTVLTGISGLDLVAKIVVDGFVSGRYRLSATKKEAIVALEPFKPLKKADKVVLTEEGERLARFYYPDARIHGVRA